MPKVRTGEERVGNDNVYMHDGDTPVGEVR